MQPRLSPLFFLLPALACSNPTVKAPANAIDIKGTTLIERSGDCATYANDYTASVRDIQRTLGFTGVVSISAEDTTCEFSTNAIPNHDFNDDSARFAHNVRTQSKRFVVPRAPKPAPSPSALTLSTFDAVMLNGVPVDLLSAGCFGVGDGRVGCFDDAAPYRYDPMSPAGKFGVDRHNAHTQPDGTYHYHGDPSALFDDTPGPQGSPVIGFAADGFPIYGSYFVDDTGTLRKARSGYTLKEGERPGGPGGAFDGTFTDDYVFTDAGDLDACNGMTVNGQYGYYVTDAYPWILACHTGIPDRSFSKGPPRMGPPGFGPPPPR